MDVALIATNSTCNSLADQPLAQDVGRKTRATILLVEDDPRVRQVTAEVLTMVGHTLLEARNAAEALQIFEEHAGGIQLLITDVVMPGKNGRELARELAARCPDLKTMFISGYGKNSALLAAETDHNLFYLSKPFSVPSLIQKVEFALAAPIVLPSPANGRSV